MPILDKAKVAVGLQGKSKFDLSCDHITSANFMQLQPVYYRHMIPGEKLSVNAAAFTRLMPMAVPTFGRIRLNMRAFFVPFRTVFQNFTDMITDTISNQYSASNIVNSTPIISNSNLCQYFIQYGLEGVDENAVYDVEMRNASGQSNFYCFNLEGRRMYKILRSLGYAVNWNTADTTSYSALALFCYLRVYFDWYSVSAYADSNMYNYVERILKYITTSTPYYVLTTDLHNIYLFSSMVSFDGDYFTAAWDSPVAPNAGGVSNNYTITDQTIPNGYTVNQATVLDSAGNAVNTPKINVDKYNGISQYSLDSLKALTDYLKRHQLSGARTIDRYLADFGINLSADKLLRSIYLGSNSIDINIGDVMSTANTSTTEISNLGDYAGQGHGAGSKTFEYECSEFGLFLVCASILPSGGYVQGYDRNNLHISRTDFFLPDFDSLGVQAIARGELFVPMNGQFYGPTGSHNGLFGYTPRYAEYKVPRSHFTGDLSLKSMFAGGDSWNLFRLFDESYFDGNPANVKHKLSFCRGTESDVEDMDRIFNYTRNDSDKFIIVYHFDVAAFAPCKSLFDTYEFANRMKQITLDANGVKLN